MLRVRVADSPEIFDELRRAWNALLDPAAPASVFLRAEWFATWYAAFGAGRPLAVHLVEDGGRLAGVLPLLREVTPHGGGLQVRRLRLLANGHSPTADLVAAGAFEPAVLAALLRALERNAETWDETVLPEVAASSGLHRLTQRWPAARAGLQLQRSSPYIPLHGTWEDYARKVLSKRFLKVLRNNVNRVSRHAEAVVERFETTDTIAAHLADMFAIGERSWQGEARSAVGSTPENRAFYRGLVDWLAPEGRLRLWFLRLGGERVAFEFHVVHGGVAFGLKTGFDRAHEALGIGTYLDQHIVRALFAEDGLVEYNLLGNADFYKQRWTPYTRDHVRLQLFGTSAVARLRALWNLRLVPALKEHTWVRDLQALLAAQRAARRQTT